MTGKDALVPDAIGPMVEGASTYHCAPVIFTPTSKVVFGSLPM